MSKRTICCMPAAQFKPICCYAVISHLIESFILFFQTSWRVSREKTQRSVRRRPRMNCFLVMFGETRFASWFMHRLWNDSANSGHSELLDTYFVLHVCFGSPPSWSFDCNRTASVWRFDTFAKNVYSSEIFPAPFTARLILVYTIQSSITYTNHSNIY